MSSITIPSLIAILCGSTLLAANLSAAEPTPSPNIVVILADDHAQEAVGCYGSQIVQTPNIDRLASKGMRFEQAMATDSMCSPSRATLLTGKYNHKCGVERLDGGFDGSQQTFPKLLQKAGYQTAIVGKWHLYTQPTGFDFYSVLPGQGKYIDCPMKETGQPWGKGDAGGVVHKGYVTDVITDISLDWLKHRDPGKPFCLLIHHKAPHDPHTVAPRFRDALKDKVFPVPSNLVDDYAGRAPEKVVGNMRWSDLLAQQGDPAYTEVMNQYTGDRSHDLNLMYQEYVRNYARLVMALDENVGRVLNYLDESGLAKNTIVMYLSDNGFFLGEHGFHNKMWMYEESLHIPLLIRLPEGFDGVKGGRVNHEFVGTQDIAPTILDLAGVKVPEDIQGKSVRPLLDGKDDGWRQAFYYHYYGTIWTPREDNYIAYHEVIGVRTKTTKLVFYPNWKGGPFWEYFDLMTDPKEMNNLIGDSTQEKAIDEMKEKLRDLAKSYEDTDSVRLIEDDFKPSQFPAK